MKGQSLSPRANQLVKCGSPGQRPRRNPLSFIVRFALTERAGWVQGDLTAFKENGTVHGTARTAGPVIALRPSANSPVFVTAAGVGWLDLRTMVASDHTCVFSCCHLRAPGECLLGLLAVWRSVGVLGTPS